MAARNGDNESSLLIKAEGKTGKTGGEMKII